MRKNLFFMFIIYLALICSVSSFAQSGETYVLKKTSYYDSKYQDNAFTILVPDDWNFKGNIIFGPAPLVTLNVFYEIIDNSGTKGVLVSGFGLRYLWSTPAAGPVGQLLQSMEGQMYNGSLVHPTLSPNEFYYKFIYPENMKKYQNFQITGMSLNPSKAEIVYANAMRDPQVQSLVSYGLAQVYYEVLDMSCEFTINGRKIEGQSEGVFEYLTNQNGHLTWGMTTGYSIFAEKGEVDDYETLFKVLTNSFTFNANWLLKVQRHRSQLMNIALDAQDYTRKVNESIQRNNDSIYDMCMKKYSDAYRGISEYEDPFYGETKWLPNTYENIWMNANGDVILTDQVLNPNEGSEFGANEWRRIDTDR